MGVSSVVNAIIAVVILVIFVFLIWWLRYSEKKFVVQNVRRHPEPYVGRLARNIYHIPLSHIYTFQTPPPTFSKAVKCPIPRRASMVLSIEDLPPPTYEQYLKGQQQSIYQI